MLGSTKALLADELIANIKQPAAGEWRYWDACLTGFLVRIWRLEAQSVLYAISAGKRTEMHTIASEKQLRIVPLKTG